MSQEVEKSQDTTSTRVVGATNVKNSSSSGSKTLTATPPDEENLVDENTWGRLFPLKSYFMKIDLSKDEYAFGRHKSCECSFDPAVVPINSIAHKVFKMCSSVQFKLHKENDKSKNCFYVFIEDTSRNGTYVNGTKIGQGKKFVLKNNDMIAMNTPGSDAFVYMESGKSEIDVPEEFNKKYILSRQIGKGAFGTVKLAFERGTCIRYAVKILDRKVLSTQRVNFMDNTEKIMAEVNILKAVSHPCIVKIESFSMTQDNLFIVLEYAGGELYKKVYKRDLDEATTKFYFYQIVLATKYLHDKGITHRDLKLDNILLESEEKETLIKVTDFGLSKIVGEGSMMDSIVGTLVYLAPEIMKSKFMHHKNEYSNKVDCWSLGVILYMCLVGYPPFSDDETVVKARGKTLEHQILAGDYQFRASDWSKYSKEVQDLIRKLLLVNPDKRLTTSQILSHLWLQDGNMKNRVKKLMMESHPLNSPSVTSPDNPMPSGSGITRHADPERGEGNVRKKFKKDDDDDDDTDMVSVTGSSHSSMDISSC